MQVDNKYKKVFSKNLNYYMNLRGKTQTDIIDDLEINKSAISSWCLGNRLPRMNKVEMLAKYLNINVSDLIEGSCKDKHYFEFISEDDAMLPLLDIGDVAFIEKTTEFQSGQTILFKLDNKEYIRKVLKDNDSFEFHAMNPYFPILKLTRKELKIKNFTVIGRVIKIENKSAFK